MDNQLYEFCVAGIRIAMAAGIDVPGKYADATVLSDRQDCLWELGPIPNGGVLKCIYYMIVSGFEANRARAKVLFWLRQIIEDIADE